MQNKENITFLALLKQSFQWNKIKKWFKAYFETFIQEWGEFIEKKTHKSEKKLKNGQKLVNKFDHLIKNA